MRKVYYQYKSYKNFPGASDASRKNNLLYFGVFFLSATIFILVGNISPFVGFIVFLVSIPLFIMLIMGSHDPSVLRAMFNQLNELSSDQKKEIINYCMHGKKIGKGDMNVAYDIATELLHFEMSLHSGEITKKEYNERKHQLLERYSINDLEYNQTTELSVPTYCFENVSEYRLYCRTISKNVNWNRDSSVYRDMISVAEEKYNFKDYKGAVSIYKESLNYNPIGIYAHFQLVLCYLQLDELENAVEELQKLGLFLSEEKDMPSKDIAAFYRYWGYVLVQREEYSLAYSCYKYSLLFYESDVAFDEMTYIEDISGSHYIEIDFRKTIVESSIPFIPER